MTKVPPHNFGFSASYDFGKPVRVTVAGQIGPDPDEDWMLGVEVVGKPWPGWRYELFAIARRFDDGRLSYGAHSYLRWKFSDNWAVLAQLDWLNSEVRRGKERITRHYRATLGVWYEPVSFLRLQVDGGYDGLRGATRQDAGFVEFGATAQFP